MGMEDKRLSHHYPCHSDLITYSVAAYEHSLAHFLEKLKKVIKTCDHWGLYKYLQGGHSTGKTGNLAVNFSRQGKHREFSKFIFLCRENGANIGKILNFLKILLLKWQQGDGAFLS